MSKSNRLEQFGKYILLEKLATGGMAEVFLSRASGAEGIAKFVAIKRILPQFSDTPEFIDMFKDEAKIAVNLNHSNIVSIHEFGVQANQFFLVMDYVEGRNLRQILNKMKKAPAKFSVDQIVFVIKEVAAGLDHAHRCLDGATGKPLNITHRDMSPQNVMVSFEGEVKIVDFGIAKAESQLETTRAGTLKGKFGYMSPEQAEGQAVDLRTDIFSLGICLWELLANDRLFAANNEINTLRKIRDCQVPSLRKLNPNIHAELERIVQKALARDRNLRYQTAAALHRDLNRFLNRQYPDFSPHDFSVFIKTLFADEILSTRNRLIEYAKLSNQGSSKAPSEKNSHEVSLLTGNTNSFVSIGDSPDIVAKNQKKPHFGTLSDIKNQAPEKSENSISVSDINFARPESNPGPSQPQPAPAAANSSLALDSISLAANPPSNPAIESPAPASEMDATQIQNGDPLALDEKALARESVRRMSNFAPNPYSIEAEEDGYTVSRYTQTRAIPKRSRSFNILPSLVGVAFVFAAYVYMAKFFTEPMLPVIRVLDPILSPIHRLLDIQGQKGLASRIGEPPKLTAPSIPAPIAVPQVAAPASEAYASQELGFFIISSTPSGAEIFVNGRNTGLITPSRIEITSPQPFHITLKKPGFIDFNKNNLTLAKIGSKLNANMQKALVGYVDIDVRPPVNARVFINGSLLRGERLPITNYAVPADTKVVIYAEDPSTEMRAKKVIVVSQDRRTQVVLNLKKEKSSSRVPSNQ